MSAEPDGRLIESMYDAAVGDTSWGDVARGIAERVTARGVDLVIRGDPSRHLELDVQRALALHTYLPREAVETYAEHFATEDELARCMYEAPPETTWLQQDLIDQDRWRKSPVYNEWMLPHGVAWIAGSRSRLSPGSCLALAAHRGEPFERAEQRVLEELRPHIVRALEIQFRIAPSQSSRLVAWAALDALADAVFALDASGAILHANERGEALRAGGLVPKRAPGTGPVFDRVPARTRVRDRELTWVFHAVPPRIARTGAVALAFVTTDDALALPSARELRATFDLTPAESRVVRGLLAGASLADIARRGRVSTGTCRNQLKAAFQKTGTSRQAELVSRIAATFPRLRRRRS